MSTPTAPRRLYASVSALVGALSVAGLVALSPSLAQANPVATPSAKTGRSVRAHKAEMQTYVLRFGTKKKVVQAKRIKIVHPHEQSKSTSIFVDGKELTVSGVVSVAVASFGGSGTGTGTCTVQSQTTTTTQLSGGGTRTDIDHADGSSTTTIHDPHGGTNGGTRTTTRSSDRSGKTTTSTTITDGGGRTTTTITASS